MIEYTHILKAFNKKIFYCTLIFIALTAQAISQPTKKTLTPKPYKTGTKEFVISYAIVVSGDKLNGLAETYNGGLKTAFIKGDVARLRLVSLMRTQSVFFNNKKGQSKKIATIVKESGKYRTKMILDNKQWKKFNAKSDSVKCEIIKDDTIRILNFLCTKAIITNKDSAKLEVYFYPSTKNKTLAAAEPLFACIPGLVMKYSYTKEARKIEYVATNLKTGTIAPSSFIIPSKNYLVQKYKPSGVATLGNMEDEEDEEGTEEEEMETPATGTPSATPNTEIKVPSTTTPSIPEVKPPAKK
jgi:hypothetical protein